MLTTPVGLAIRKAVTKVQVESRIVGLAGSEKVQSVGTACRVQRNPSNPGQFVIWFSGYHYTTRDAKDIEATVTFTSYGK